VTKRLKATIQPAVLVWARTTAGYEIAGAAEKIDIAPESLAAWEAGGDQPSIAQLRKLAELYKRPLAVMYLPEPPTSFRAMHDFRRLPDAGGGRYSPGLTHEIRLAQQRRELAIELLEEDGAAHAEFRLSTQLRADPETVGGEIRRALAITYELQSKWRDPRVGFNAWRTRIEQQGVLIFQGTRFDPEEASGFALWDSRLPVIVVNRKDAPSRRVFSLLHELSHLMLHQSGVSDLDEASPRSTIDQATEVFCNGVAAAALIPGDRFLSEDVVAGRSTGHQEWSDEDIEELAKRYSTSREAVVRRLVTFGRASETFYGQKRAKYATEFQEQRQRQKDAKKPIPRNMPRETIADYGRPFVRMVLEQYHQDRLTLADVSGYLGVKARHIADIEQQVGGL